MRYIKGLNEDKLEQWEITDIHNDVNDILDNYSTYLVDKGFKFELEFPYYEDRDVLRITLTRGDDRSNLHAKTLKDILDDSIRLISIDSIKFIDINIFLVSKVKKPSLVSRFKNFFKKK